MKHIHLNLKRFDIKKIYGGVNQSDDITLWSSSIVEKIEKELEQIKKEKDVEFTIFFPELHLLNAIKERKNKDSFFIGSQSVYELDSKVGGNFGAFTTKRTANSMVQAGVDSTMIAHSEERESLKNVLRSAGVNNFESINKILNQRIKRALESGLRVLYCIGETLEERENWKDVLKSQIEIGLDGVDKSKIIIAYEPIWAIGPGKTLPSYDAIDEIVRYVKEISNNCEVIYGGGLKKDNAKALSEIKSLDGGLIALTRFSGEIGFYPDEYIEIIKEFLYK
ncbi:MAG: triose-phosphate isomerase family protein [Peptoniphilaceae bacterium]|nr:triose-phosphate isomerase [Peptoniphilaceae bacterium]MDD7382798.1 triose-phosphate isomerase [Peptoniphilaceae bacterium]MDY3737956.1 triose-phosphate isomerase family protein [Peptoniphilaceae bacterium]